MQVKVCCIASADEARMAIAAGASAIGLVSAMPSGPGPIPDGQIAEIACGLPPGFEAFLLTCLQHADTLAEQQRRLGVRTLQLVDYLAPTERRRLRRLLPGVRLVQVVHVEGEASLERAREAAESADALLLDSGRPSAAVKELGGTGRVHDWAVSRRIVERSPIPVYLAGGLTAANVAEAVRTVQPFGVDVCSGVRTNGPLDGAKLRGFIHAARGVE